MTLSTLLRDARLATAAAANAKILGKINAILVDSFTRLWYNEVSERGKRVTCRPANWES
jgi:hypothetical protein